MDLPHHFPIGTVTIKLYLDEDVDPLLDLFFLRKRGIDCLSTREAQNLGHSDVQQLTFAITEKGQA